MRRSLIMTIAMFGLMAAQMAGADEPGPQPQYQPQVQQQEYEQPPYQSNAIINNNANIAYQNPGYQFQNPAVYLAPGQGLPPAFRCTACFVRTIGFNYSEVIAQDPYVGYFRIWGGPTQFLVPAVNAIKMQTGMCSNLPYIPVPPMPLAGGTPPPILPMGGPATPPMPQPLYNQGYNPGFNNPMVNPPMYQRPYGGGPYARPPMH